MLLTSNMPVLRDEDARITDPEHKTRAAARRLKSHFDNILIFAVYFGIVPRLRKRLLAKQLHPLVYMTISEFSESLLIHSWI